MRVSASRPVPCRAVQNPGHSLYHEVVMEQINVAGNKLKSTLKNLIREGNVRRIIEGGVTRLPNG